MEPQPSVLPVDSASNPGDPDASQSDEDSASSCDMDSQAPARPPWLPCASFVPGGYVHEVALRISIFSERPCELHITCTVRPDMYQEEIHTYISATE